MLVDEGRDNPNTMDYMRAIIGPPAKRHLNGTSLEGGGWPNIKCWLGCFVIFRGIRTNIDKKSYSFVLWKFSGGGVRNPCDLLGVL